MNIIELSILVKDGVHSVIEFNKSIEDLEGYAEKGMRARVIGAENNLPDNLIRFKIDYSEFEEFNREIESSNYYDGKGNAVLTAREAGFYKQVETYYFEPKDDIEKYFEVVDTNSLELYACYKASKKPWSYLRWLEENLRDRFILKAVPF